MSERELPSEMPISADVLYTHILSKSPPLDKRSYRECLNREENVFNAAMEVISKKDSHVVLANFTKIDICGNSLLLHNHNNSKIIDYKTGIMINRTGILKANSLYIVIQCGRSIFVEDLRRHVFFLVMVSQHIGSIRIEIEGNYILMIYDRWLILINLQTRTVIPVHPYIHNNFVSVQLIHSYFVVVSKKIYIYRLCGNHIVSHIKIPIFDTYPISYSNIYVLYVCDNYVVMDLLQEELAYIGEQITTSYIGKLLVFIINPCWDAFDDSLNTYFNILGSGLLIGFLTTLTYIPRLSIMGGCLLLKFSTGESVVNIVITRRGYRSTTLFNVYGENTYNHNGNFIGKTFTFRRKLHTSPVLRRLKFLSYGEGNPTMWVDRRYPGELRGVG